MPKAKINKRTGLPNAAPRYGKNKKRSEHSKRLWADPEIRAKMLDARRNKRGNTSRYGIPHGMRREEAEAEWAWASFYANKVTRIMKEEGIIEDDPKVEKAFSAAVEVLESPMSQSIKLQAARLLLDFCKAKPVAKQEITVARAEDWLSSVTQDYYQKQGISYGEGPSPADEGA